MSVSQYESVAEKVADRQAGIVVAVLGSRPVEDLDHQVWRDRDERGIGRVQQANLQEQDHEWPSLQQPERRGEQLAQRGRSDRCVPTGRQRLGHCEPHAGKDQRAQRQQDELDRAPAAEREHAVAEDGRDHLHHEHDHGDLRHRSLQVLARREVRDDGARRDECRGRAD